MKNDERLKTIEKIMRDNSIMGEVVDSSVNENGMFSCSVLVEWGDWKHSHGRLDYLVNNELKPISIDSVVTEEDGSDTYSAKHTYCFEN